MKKEIYIITIASILFLGCSDNKTESKVLDKKDQVIKTEQTSSNEIALQNDKEFYSIKKEEFKETNNDKTNVENPEVKIENKEINQNENPEDKSKVVGVLKEINAMYVKTKENLPATTEDSIKVIKEKTSEGADYATNYAKQWIKDSWEESKRNTQEAKLKRNEEAKK